MTVNQQTPVAWYWTYISTQQYNSAWTMLQELTISNPPLVSALTAGPLQSWWIKSGPLVVHHELATGLQSLTHPPSVIHLPQDLVTYSMRCTRMSSSYLLLLRPLPVIVLRPTAAAQYVETHCQLILPIIINGRRQIDRGTAMADRETAMAGRPHICSGQPGLRVVFRSALSHLGVDKVLCLAV